MAAPAVYAAINAVSAELAKTGIAKTHTNTVDDYKYRSIDDVLNRLAPLLAQHRLCILPWVVEREAIERHDEMERPLFHVALRVAYTLTSVDDGSNHIIECYGEALDPSDKGTAKAMSAAYKAAMAQAFCIPYGSAEEPDQTTYRPCTRTHVPEPAQGWQQWVTDIADIIVVCESEEAISLLKESNRELLQALNRERFDLFRQLGAKISTRLAELSARRINVRTVRRPRSKSAKNTLREPADA